MMNLWAEQKRKAEAARATVDAALAANAAGQGPGPTGEAIRNAEDWERVAAEHLRAADEFWRSVQRWGEPARR